MRVRLKNLCMCTGDLYEDVVADVEQEFIDYFLKLECDDTTPVYINPEAVASFQMEEIKDKPKLNIVK